jgi:AcrR family transcriptional regulator
MLAARSRKARTNSRGVASREQILEAAVDLLRDHGYAGLSIARICNRADVAPTSVYWHFGSKAGLMEAVIARIGGSHTGRIREFAARGKTPAERLDLLIEGLRELVTSQPLGSLTGVAIVGEGRHVTPELRQALRHARDQELKEVTRDFEGALGGDRQTGEAIAIVVMSCTNYAALSYRIDGDMRQVDRILEGLRAAIVRIVGPGIAAL